METRGLALKTIKKHAGAIPLFIIIGTTLTCAFGFAVYKIIETPAIDYQRRIPDTK